MPAWQALTLLVRHFVVAFALAYLVARLGIVGWKSALQLGLLLWIGFPAVLLAGSVIHDNVPWMLAAIHAGDWLVKILLMTVILGVWRRSKTRGMIQKSTTPSKRLRVIDGACSSKFRIHARKKLPRTDCLGPP